MQSDLLIGDTCYHRVEHVFEGIHAPLTLCTLQNIMETNWLSTMKCLDDDMRCLKVENSVMGPLFSQFTIDYMGKLQTVSLAEIYKHSISQTHERHSLNTEDFTGTFEYYADACFVSSQSVIHSEIASSNEH